MKTINSLIQEVLNPIHNSSFNLNQFAEESNNIERITLSLAHKKLETSLKWFIALESLSLESIQKFALELSPKCVIRDAPGMDVRIEGFKPLSGGDRVRTVLCNLIKFSYDPYYTHRGFETLHPFMDGNGRTGRAIWLWQMLDTNQPISGGFLRTWYYQTLRNSR